MEIARRSFRKYADTYKAFGKMTEPEWLDTDIVLDIHAEQLAIFGGGDGMRDLGLLESALARPLNKFAYGEDRSRGARRRLCVRASPAIMPLSMATSGPPSVSMIVFLGLNGIDLDVPPEDATAIILELAAGEIERGRPRALAPRQLAEGLRRAAPFDCRRKS